jgi:membrane protease YdiL (CAAX protease family)
MPAPVSDQARRDRSRPFSLWLPRLLTRFSTRRALVVHGLITWLWHAPFVVAVALRMDGRAEITVPLVLAVSLVPTVMHAIVFACVWSISRSLLVATTYHAAFDEVRDTLQASVGLGVISENWQAVVLTLLGSLLLWRSSWATGRPETRSTPEASPHGRT